MDSGLHDTELVARDGASGRGLGRPFRRRFGGPPELYLPLHQWLLAPCNWVPTSAHLIFRHNAFALFEAERRFGPALGEQGRAVPTRVVAERHVRMVLGRIPAASDLLRRFRGERWMVRAVSPDELGLT